MKIPTPERLPSGQWRVRLMIDGKKQSITRATEKECIAEAVSIKTGHKAAQGPDKTLSQAIDKFIEDRENVLSPSTIRGYRFIQKGRFQKQMKMRLSDLTHAQCQKAVNAESKLCSAKTLKNAWGLVSSVIADQTGQHYTVRLPQVVHRDLPFLTAEQIPIFLDSIRGNPYEIPILLALSSLRRSEIMAVRYRDIDLSAGVIHVEGSAVYDEDDNLIQKETNKNTSSRRTIPFIIPQLRDAIERTSPHDPDSLVAACYPNTIKLVIDRTCEKLGFPKIGAHGLRRSAASLMYSLGISEQICMEICGWSDIYTMRKIYIKISEHDKQTAATAVLDFFNSKPTEEPATH